jgi:hypothetical protein
MADHRARGAMPRRPNPAHHEDQATLPAQAHRRALHVRSLLLPTVAEPPDESRGARCEQRRRARRRATDPGETVNLADDAAQLSLVATCAAKLEARITEEVGADEHAWVTERPQLLGWPTWHGDEATAPRLAGTSA